MAEKALMWVKNVETFCFGNWKSTKVKSKLAWNQIQPVTYTIPFCCFWLIELFSFYGRLVSGAGDIKLTKDGNVLLHEMVGGKWMWSFGN